MTHSFDIQDAAEFGVDAAIIIQDFGKWIFYKKTNGQNLFDGRTWIFNSKKALALQFPYWSEKQLRRILEALLDDEVLLSANHNEDRRDHTLWYAFVDEARFVDRWKVNKVVKSDVPKRAIANAQMGKSNGPNGQNSIAQTGTSDLPKRADHIIGTPQSTSQSTSLLTRENDENFTDEEQTDDQPQAPVNSQESEKEYEVWQGVEPGHQNSIRISYEVGTSYIVAESEILVYLKSQHERHFIGYCKNWDFPRYVPDFFRQYNCKDFTFDHLDRAIVAICRKGQERQNKVTTGFKSAQNQASPTAETLPVISEQARQQSISRFVLKKESMPDNNE